MKGSLSRRWLEVRSEPRRRLALASGFALFRSFGIDRLDELGSAVGAGWQGRWLRILTITGGSSIAAMIFKAPAQFGQCSTSISKTCLSSRAQLMRGGAPCA